jgi:peptidoglycan/xylan/chitin deacetylase (PgdA/CDA1 family)
MRRKRPVLYVVLLLLLIASFSVLAVQPAGIVGILARATPRIVWRVETWAPLAALTFDDGPDPVYTPRVLDILARHEARATFFLIGANARRHPEQVRRIREMGHEVGNHTDSRGATALMSMRRFSESLLRAEAALAMPEGEPKLFRPGSGWIRPAQLDLAIQRGYTCVLGSAYAYDPKRPPTAYIRWAIRKNLRPGAIVVLHDAGGDRSNTLAALPGILEDGRAKGLRFVTVSELMAAPR